MHKAHSQLRRYVLSTQRACNQCKRHSCYLPQLIGAPLGGQPHLGSLLGQVAGSWTLTQHRALCPVRAELRQTGMAPLKRMETTYLYRANISITLVTETLVQLSH